MKWFRDIIVFLNIARDEIYGFWGGGVNTIFRCVVEWGEPSFILHEKQKQINHFFVCGGGIYFPFLFRVQFFVGNSIERSREQSPNHVTTNKKNESK